MAPLPTLPEYHNDDPVRIRKLLVAHAYWPVPVKGKRPQIAKWTTFRPKIEQIEGQARSHSDHPGTGIMTGEVVAIDIDALDPEAAAHLTAMADRLPGAKDALRRVGRAPKLLLMFRATEVRRKIATAEYLVVGQKCQVEVLGRGQQFAAFGVHPDTGKPYEWLTASPLDVPLADLPEITPEAIDAFVAEAKAYLASVGVPLKAAKENTRVETGSPTGETFWQRVNSAALADIDRWVRDLFSSARKEAGTGAWRVTSKDLGRALEEDISIHPEGVQDFGLEKSTTPIQLVVDYGGAPTPKDGAHWLCDRLGIDPADLGWDAEPRQGFTEGQIGAGARIAAKAKTPVAANDNNANAPEYHGELADAHYSRLQAFRQSLEGKGEIVWNGDRWQIEGATWNGESKTIAVEKGRLTSDSGENVEEPPAQRFSIFDWPASRYVGKPEDVKWLVRNSIPLGVPAMVAAMGDTGKSYSLLELHRRVAFPRKSVLPDPIFGGEVFVEGTSVMLTSEDDYNEVHRRLDALDEEENRKTSLGDKMIVVPMPSAGGTKPFWRDDRKLGLIETDEFKRFCDELMSIRDLKVFSVDTLSSFGHLPVNEDPAAAQFICTSMGRLATETGATGFLSHHMRKSAKPIESLADAREAIRGSSALVDGLRVVYAFWHPEEPRARKVCKTLGEEFVANKVVLGGVVKANGGAKRTISTYVRNDFGLLVDKTARLGTQAPAQDDIKSALVLAIEGAAVSGQPFTKTGATGLFAMKERLPVDLRSISRHKMEGVATKLIEDGDVVLCLAGGTTAKWLDVPGGPFAIGLGEFRKGMAR